MPDIEEMLTFPNYFSLNREWTLYDSLFSYPSMTMLDTENNTAYC